MYYYYHPCIPLPRDYITELRKSFPDLPQSLCDEYTNYYESAVFGDQVRSYHLSLYI